MAVHVEEMVTEVTVVDAELPLTRQQLDKIADYVIASLEQRDRDRAMGRAATALRPTSQPQPSGAGEV